MYIYAARMRIIVTLRGKEETTKKKKKKKEHKTSAIRADGAHLLSARIDNPRIERFSFDDTVYIFYSPFFVPLSFIQSRGTRV